MYEPRLTCNKRGVPILSHEDIEFYAEQFIREYEPGILKNPKPVDVEGFTEFYLGLTPEYNNLTHCGLILGRMVFNDSRKVPIYDAQNRVADYISAERGTVMVDNLLLNDEHRLRSTMGHEAGHWIFHQPYFYVDPFQMTLFDTFDKTSTACRKFDIEGGDCSEGTRRTLVTDHDWLEHQAKYFSAALLMPREAMKVACGNPQMRVGIMREFPGYEENVLAEHVSDIFNVSVESAKIRIRQLGLGIESAYSNRPSFITVDFSESMYM